MWFTDEDKSFLKVEKCWTKTTKKKRRKKKVEKPPDELREFLALFCTLFFGVEFGEQNGRKEDFCDRALGFKQNVSKELNAVGEASRQASGAVALKLFLPMSLINWYILSHLSLPEKICNISEISLKRLLTPLATFLLFALFFLLLFLSKLDLMFLPRSDCGLQLHELNEVWWTQVDKCTAHCIGRRRRGENRSPWSYKLIKINLFALSN